jgi:hypothetical protein
MLKNPSHLETTKNQEITLAHQPVHTARRERRFCETHLGISHLASDSVGLLYLRWRT